MWGPDDSFHLNPMLLQNIIKSSYFQKCCRDILDYNSLVDQIYYDVKHVEPWAQGEFLLCFHTALYGLFLKVRADMVSCCLFCNPTS